MNEFKFVEVKHLLNGWRQSINAISKELSVSCNEIEKQVVLHLPLLLSDPDLEIDVVPFPVMLKKILYKRFAEYSVNYSDYVLRSGGVLLSNIPSILFKNSVCVNGDSIANFSIKQVSISLGIKIERNLHYLRLAREDSIARYGLFMDGYDYPICYMAFSVNDRRYRKEALIRSMGMTELNLNIIQLTRVYGFGNLPRNSISKLVSFCAKEFRKNGYEYMITAVNPFIGFTGSSILSSGFRPFAFCPVGYRYNLDGEYVGRRSFVSDISEAKLRTPPNILYVKGLSRKSIISVNNISSPEYISIESFNDII